MTATIIQLRQAECGEAEIENRGQVAKQASGQSAEIVIFPGVRIERQKNHETGGEPAKPRKRG